jgi:diguanylate cyclase (GGDEF)-like protein
MVTGARDAARGLEFTTAVARLLSRYAIAQHAREGARDLAARDALTGLFNRGYLYQRLEDELTSARSSGRPLGVIILDVDAFKVFNTTLGYRTGDAVLQRVAACIQRDVRTTDVACRLGGDEFVAVLIGASLEATVQRARVLVNRISSASYVDEPALFPAVTVSAGVATFPAHADDAAALLHRADMALRAAKLLGSESVYVVANSSTIQGSIPGGSGTVVQVF